MRMRYYIAIPIFLITFLFQTTVWWRLFEFGNAPNLILCLTVVYSFIYDEKFGLILGLASGLLLDLSTSMVFGTQTFSFFLIFVMIRLFRMVLNHEKVLPDILMIVLATVVNNLVVWGVCKYAGSPVAFVVVLKNIPALLISQSITVLIMHLLLVRTVINNRADRRFESEFRL